MPNPRTEAFIQSGNAPMERITQDLAPIEQGISDLQAESDHLRKLISKIPGVANIAVPDFTVSSFWELDARFQEIQSRGTYTVRGLPTYTAQTVDNTFLNPHLRDITAVWDVPNWISPAQAAAQGIWQINTRLFIPFTSRPLEWIVAFELAESEYDADWNVIAWRWELRDPMVIAMHQQTFGEDRGMIATANPPATMNWGNMSMFTERQGFLRSAIRTSLTLVAPTNHILDFNSGNAMFSGSHQLNPAQVIMNNPPTTLTGTLIRTLDVRQLPSNMIEQTLTMRRNAATIDNYEIWTRIRRDNLNWTPWLPVNTVFRGRGTPVAAGMSGNWQAMQTGNIMSVWFQFTFSARTVAAGTELITLPVGIRPQLTTNILIAWSDGTVSRGWIDAANGSLRNRHASPANAVSVEGNFTYPVSWVL